MMQIKAEELMGTLVIKDRSGGYVYTDDRWPKRINVNHLLRALCGKEDAQGYFPYFEGDRRWIAICLETVSGMTPQEIGAMAMHDHCQIDDGEIDRSLVAAASLAVVLIERAFEAEREESQLIVRMNLSSQGVAA
jgi:hypothetical protein